MRVALWMMLGWVAIGCDAKRAPGHDGGWFGDVETDSLRPDSGVEWSDEPPRPRPQAGRSGGYAPEPERERDGGVAGRGAAGSAGAPAPKPDAGGPSSASMPVRTLAYGALVITELMADPDARSDSDGEWFELYNTTAEDADLAGCTIGDGGAKPRAIAEMARVAARSYVSIAGTSDAGFDADIVSSLSLKNGAGAIELHCGGVLIDRVSYDKAQGFPLAPGIAAALDPMHVDADANDDAAVWCRAVDAYASDRGTPGRANPPCTAGVPDAGVQAPTPMANEPVDARPEPPAVAYGAVVVTEFMADPDAVNDAQGEWFEVYNTTSEAIDLAGCTVHDGAAHPIQGALRVAARSHATLANAADPGFAPTLVSALSLTNTADVIELRCGEVLVDRVAYDAAAGFPLKAGVATMLRPAHLDADANDQPSNWCLSATEFATDFGTPGGANGACALAASDADAAAPDADAAASSDDAPRPPASAPAAEPRAPLPYGAVVFSEIMADPEAIADAEGEWVELCNTTSETIDLTGCTLGGDTAEPHAIDQPVRIAAGDYATVASGAAPGFSATYVRALSLTNSADVVELRCGGELVDRVAYDAAAGFPVATGVAAMLDPSRLDADSNDDPSAWCLAAAPYETDLGTPGGPNDTCAESPATPPPAALPYGALVITELMADPQALSDAEGEWFELYNATSEMVDLAGCSIAGGGEALHDIVASVGVAAGGYATVARAAAPGFSATWVSPMSLANGSGVIELRCGGELVDRVAYDGAQGFPLQAGAAAMLDPTQLDADGNDLPSAWCPATLEYATDLGTPGAANPPCSQIEEADAGASPSP